MRLIKQGVTVWGPVEKTCSHCRDVYEILKSDLFIHKDMCDDQRDGPYPCNKIAWKCPTCNTINKIWDAPQALMTELALIAEGLKRPTQPALPSGDYDAEAHANYYAGAGSVRTRKSR